MYIYDHKETQGATLKEYLHHLRELNLKQLLEDAMLLVERVCALMRSVTWHTFKLNHYTKSQTKPLHYTKLNHFCATFVHADEVCDLAPIFQSQTQPPY